MGCSVPMAFRDTQTILGKAPAPPPDKPVPYRLRFAETEADRLAAYRLRFLVFNLELKEGLLSAYQEGYDRDEFDEVCDHLLVEHTPSRQIIATYRLQTGRQAAQRRGYYSAREFDFSPYEPYRAEMVELGRAAVHRRHRSFEVLIMLWRGIARYAQEKGTRYLIGCCSCPSESPEDGLALFTGLRGYLVRAEFRTQPHNDFTCVPNGFANRTEEPRVPKLLRTYLALGARICGQPALDRGFRTIDFLTLLDMQRLSPSVRARFLC